MTNFSSIAPAVITALSSLAGIYITNLISRGGNRKRASLSNLIKELENINAEKSSIINNHILILKAKIFSSVYNPEKSVYFAYIVATVMLAVWFLLIQTTRSIPVIFWISIFIYWIGAWRFYDESKKRFHKRALRVVAEKKDLKDVEPKLGKLYPISNLLNVLSIILISIGVIIILKVPFDSLIINYIDTWVIDFDLDKQFSQWFFLWSSLITSGYFIQTMTNSFSNALEMKDINRILSSKKNHDR